MEFVLGISEGSWVSIGVVVGPLLIIGLIAFIVYKAKSEIMITVDNKIAEELAPIEKRMDKHDTDFKDFKRDEIEPMKKDIHELITRQSVIDTKVDNVLIGIGRIEEYLKERDRSYKENFLLLFSKIDTKQDKKN